MIQFPSMTPDFFSPRFEHNCISTDKSRWVKYTQRNLKIFDAEFYESFRSAMIGAGRWQKRHAL
jgi:hypothetical protein